MKHTPGEWKINDRMARKMYKLIKELDRLKYYITIESDFTDDWNKLQKELEAIQKATP